MSSILDKIVAVRKKRLESEKNATEISVLEQAVADRGPVADFSAAFPPGRINIIAEIKKASPSKGVLKADLDPVFFARLYEREGASAISVLTEEDHFMGSLLNLGLAAKSVKIPVMRKDFIFDPYQILQAGAFGADSFLLIAAILDEGSLSDLIGYGRSLGMEPLVEVHDGEELDRALGAGALLIGVNNRNLKDFSVTLNTTLELMKNIPDDRIVISESGIKTRSDMDGLLKAGVRGFLIGESIVTAEDPARKLRELTGGN